ncbi:hypothetical protein CALVIDRAFT_598387 [Calocera viscosa TUFC12733]|uniref:RGS domain-containing protein n=1 Tax=Calocera viscosa (strain TUFC12733) TaxID=1330018 RepID=A0A167M8J7_CALVF|nr:hypothetical protein CALVIDRAFT_598387 [Calocera viscosa TUFC12733]
MSSSALPLYRLDGTSTSTTFTLPTHPLRRRPPPSARIIHPNPSAPSRRLPLSFLASAQPIPPSLSLSHVLSDDLCAPLTLRDFFNFLAERERAPENLAFVLWYRAYERRFMALPAEERGRAEQLHPAEEWRKYAEERECERLERAVREQEDKEDEWENSDGPKPWECISLERMGAESPFADPLGVHRCSPSPSSTDEERTQSVDLTAQAAMDAETLAIAPWMVDEVGARDRARMAEISRQADEELQRTVSLLMRDNLPLRDEIVRAVQHFLTPASPYALSSSHIPALLLTLRRTTHPCAFLPLYNELLLTLTLDAHPRFVRSALANTRTPLRLAVYALAIGLYLLGGIALGLACVLTGVSRWWRIASIPLVWAGMAVSLALVSGVCPMVFGTRRRQLALWEAMDAEWEGEKPGLARSSCSRTLAGKNQKQRTARAHGIFQFVHNDWWAAHPAARRMQNGVLKGAGAWAALGAGVWGVGILLVPGRG